MSKQKPGKHTKWRTVRNKKQFTKEERDCFLAGQHAFRMKIYPDGNLYRTGWQRASWLRGYKLAERLFNEQIRASRALMEAIA